MRHRVKKSRLSLSRSKRKALLIALSKSIIINGRINTTRARAKNVRRLVEHLISLGKQGNLSAKRQAYKILQDHSLVSKLFNEIAPKFKSRTGGYTRSILLRQRRGDNAQMCVFELTEKIKDIEPQAPEKEKGRIKLPRDKYKAKIPPNGPEEIIEGRQVREKPKPAPEEGRKEEKKKPPVKFLGGLRRFFKKGRDAL